MLDFPVALFANTRTIYTAGLQGRKTASFGHNILGLQISHFVCETVSVWFPVDVRTKTDCYWFEDVSIFACTRKDRSPKLEPRIGEWTEHI